MARKDPRVDAYIAKSAPFAKPVLTHFRKLVHSACPEVEETVKWGMPAFDYRGPLCGMAAFKAHCAISFWKGSMIAEIDKSFATKSNDAMGHLGRITGKTDLPNDKQLVKWIGIAAKLNEDGIKRATRPKSKTPRPLDIPDYFMAALKKNKKALATFEAFSPSHKREYVEWVTGAKQEETRLRRLATAIEWMSEGKSQNWRYERK